ncbi:MAG: helix-turn-helix transcriptional regulator [Clostridia bacterium]|nr:helix-turn-helix transcriptional regulator [Clostridia bacterium]
MSFLEDYGTDFALLHRLSSGNTGIMHIHPHWEMLLIATPEKARITVNGHFCDVDSPFLALFSPFCLHKTDFIDIDKQIERFVCYFGEEMTSKYEQVFDEYSQLLSKKFWLFRLTEEETFKCKEMIAQTSKYPHNSIPQKLIFLLILSTIFDGRKLDNAALNVDNFKICAIIKYMYEHIFENINADSVASHFHISRSKLDKDFQKHTSVSFRQLLIDMRLSHAAYLILNSTLKISEIAAMSGFENETYFYNQFKSFTGTTPLKYRKNPPKRDRRKVIQ